MNRHQSRKAVLSELISLAKRYRGPQSARPSIPRSHNLQKFQNATHLSLSLFTFYAKTHHNGSYQEQQSYYPNDLGPSKTISGVDDGHGLSSVQRYPASSTGSVTTGSPPVSSQWCFGNAWRWVWRWTFWRVLFQFYCAVHFFFIAQSRQREVTVIPSSRAIRSTFDAVPPILFLLPKLQLRIYYVPAPSFLCKTLRTRAQYCRLMNNHTIDTLTSIISSKSNLMITTVYCIFLMVIGFHLPWVASPCTRSSIPTAMEDDRDRDSLIMLNQKTCN